MLILDDATSSTCRKVVSVMALNVDLNRSFWLDFDIYYINYIFHRLAALGLDTQSGPCLVEADVLDNENKTKN